MAMGVQGRALVLFLVLATTILLFGPKMKATTNINVGGNVSGRTSNYYRPFNRTSFPVGFTFGAGSASYQSEGGANVDGRGPSIWDTFTHQHPEKISDRSNGDAADGFYHHYKDDIKLMKEIGLDSFRFSISWSRIFPKGRGEVNYLGVDFYNKLIDELLINGITPFVTLFHWDLPQGLEDAYGGLLSPKIVDDFRDYTDFCFKTFGDRVKRWLTLNEPLSISVYGYSSGIFAPGRCSNYVGNCTAGDSAIEPYIVAHHLLLAHAAAVKVYKENYQAHQEGEIGIALSTHWIEPKTNTTANCETASRALDFFFGWFASPITFGDYPESMKSYVGNRLPEFTKEQSQLLRGSLDFLGLNYYTTHYAEDAPISTNFDRSFYVDIQASFSGMKNGTPIGTPTALSWLFIYPRGLKELLLYIKNNYKDPPIYITENGVAEANNSSKPIEEVLNDGIRIRYLKGHLKYLLQAIREGVNVKGYYAWSFLDDFEWNDGYSVGCGLIYVDFRNNLKRHLKDSAHWLKLFLLN